MIPRVHMPAWITASYLAVLIWNVSFFLLRRLDTFAVQTNYVTDLMTVATLLAIAVLGFSQLRNVLTGRWQRLVRFTQYVRQLATVVLYVCLPAILLEYAWFPLHRLLACTLKVWIASALEYQMVQRELCPVLSVALGAGCVLAAVAFVVRGRLRPAGHRSNKHPAGDRQQGVRHSERLRQRRQNQKGL